MNEIIVAITLARIDEETGALVEAGACNRTIATGKGYSIVASGNLSGDCTEFLHDWIVVSDSSGNVLFAGSFSDDPTLADDPDEGIHNIGAGLAAVLADALCLTDDEPYEIFDFIENAIWQVSPHYALKFLQMQHTATIGSDRVEFAEKPRFYIDRLMGICAPARCQSADRLPQFIQALFETADFGPMRDKYELAVAIS